MTDLELTLAVVGIQYPNDDGSNRRFEIELCSPGDPIHLLREPANKHDEYAVGVFSEREQQVGHLSAERAPWIGAKLSAGEEYQAIFQGLAGGAAYVRVRFGGGAPTLPPLRETSIVQADDFQPNYEGPEWGA